MQEVVCLGDGRVIDMVQNTARTEEEDDIIDQFFEELWFDFPTPFKKVILYGSQTKKCP